MFVENVHGRVSNMDSPTMLKDAATLQAMVSYRRRRVNVEWLSWLEQSSAKLQ